MHKLINVLPLALVLVLYQVSCGGVGGEQTPVEVRQVKRYEEHARTIAQEWQQDALLFSVVIHPTATNLNRPAETADQLSFKFVSPRNTWEYLVVTFPLNGAPQISKWPLAQSPNEYVPIQSSDWTLDSTDAWRIALKEIRGTSKGSDAIDATMHLERWNPSRSGQVLWYVANRGSSPSSSMRIWIDPITGEIVDKK